MKRPPNNLKIPRNQKRNMTNPEKTMRLNRFLARAGHGSRRSVEDLIREGKVSVDGQIVKDLGRQVDPETQTVSVDGHPTQLPKDFRVYAFHKPLDVVSTLKSQGGQPSLLPYRLQSEIPDRFVAIGRLDSESTGLLLWTDDGDLNQMLCQPDGGVWKTYEVDLGSDLPATKIPLLTEGKIHIDGRPCRPCKLELAEDKTTRNYVMQLHEGRRRQIRRMFKKVGVKVIRLHRIAIGPIQLGLLRPGDFRRLTHEEEQMLRKEVALSVSKQKSHSRPRRRRPAGRKG
jgi:23S rRNA pseudouridine2605 synthase